VGLEIIRTKDDLKELVSAYARMAIGRFEAINVYGVLQKVKRQLLTRAREAHVEVLLRPQPNLPFASAIASRLQQIIVNVTLNAIQQIERQGKLMARIAHERGEDTAIYQDGLVVIQARHILTGDGARIQIIVFDTGPGVHYKDQRSIFLLDTTTREEGHGLGLFISRNLIETMKGKLYLANSVMFIGSAFVIELPAFADTGELP